MKIINEIIVVIAFVKHLNFFPQLTPMRGGRRYKDGARIGHVLIKRFVLCVVRVVRIVRLAFSHEHVFGFWCLLLGLLLVLLVGNRMDCSRYRTLNICYHCTLPLLTKKKTRGDLQPLCAHTRSLIYRHNCTFLFSFFKHRVGHTHSKEREREENEAACVPKNKTCASSFLFPTVLMLFAFFFFQVMR